jgi:hypothetical protein
MTASCVRGAVAVAAATVLGIVPSAAAQGSLEDSVTGDLFDRDTGVQVLGVDARSGPSGENPSGTATWHIGGGLGPTWNVSVTCLAVAGNTAVIGFSGTLYFFGDLSPVAGLARAGDGGGPDSGLDSFGWAETTGAPGGPAIPGPTDCSSYPSAFTPFGVIASNRTGGNLVVTDTEPVPTSTGQCKKGGWRSFGVFKNQGDCVSFVATGGKNPPGTR